MERLRPPQPLASTSDASKEWPTWRQHFEYFMIATKKNKEEGETRVAVLLTAMGRDRRRQDIQVIHLGRSRAHSKNLTKVLDAFTNYYKPKTNETYERFQFLRRKQKAGEPFGPFYTDLLRLADTCNYHAEEKNKIIRDQIAMIVTSDAVREKFLEETELTLTKAVDICRSKEATAQYLTSMSSVSAKEPDPIPEEAAYGVSKAGTSQVQQVKPCSYCGRKHRRGTCPA
jgi:hypothetical protein